MAQINAYITFNGNCREAMNFYKDCFGGELTLQTVEGTPMESQCPPAMKHHLMHAMLMNEDLVLMGTDMVGKGGFIQGTNMALALNCNTADETNSFFNYLAREGQVTHPLAEMFWGSTFGSLVDKYGIAWLFNFDKNQQKN